MTKGKGGRGWWRLVILLAVIAGLIVAVNVLPVEKYLNSLLEWVDGLGMWGPIILAAAYVVACVLFVPGSALTLGAGFLFGVVTGTIVVSLGSVLGASAAFWVGRTVARDWIGAKVAGNAKFAAIDAAVGRQGFKMVLLTRLTPVFPFNMLNYAFGLTKVRFVDYFFASWVGMLPGTIMYVYLGHAARSVADQTLSDATSGSAERTPAQQVFLWVGLVVAVVVAVFITRIARKALKEATLEADQEPPPDSPTV
jgi:uncharacterized membrane protein YdjX (TVP38/TMEM64 family)